MVQTSSSSKMITPLARLPPSKSRRVQEAVERDLELLRELHSQATSPEDYPNASTIKAKLPIYSGPDILAKILESEEYREELMDEFHRALYTGPGVIVIKGMIDREICRKVNEFNENITPGLAEMKHKRTPRFEEKHAVADPEGYADYYSSPILALACEAWLGPKYQITTQINALKAGAPQQDIHRDYHMSHMREQRIQFPAVTHILNQFLTLQCAVAHTDQPLISGPTCFLPYSNHHPNGYMNVRQPAHIEFFKAHKSQLPLELGDGVFFNPTTYHQPGVNEQDSHRTMCLFQVNSCMSRPMETKNTLVMTKAVWPVIKAWHKDIQVQGSNGSANGSLDTSKYVNGTKTHRHPLELEALIAATCEAYEYPANFDKHSKPARENTTLQAGATMYDVVHKALEEDWTDEELFGLLEQVADTRVP